VQVGNPKPASVVTVVTVVPAGNGTKGARGSADVRIDNAGTTRVAGPVSVTLYLSADPAANPAANPAGSPAAAKVATLTRRLSLEAGRGKTLHVAYRYPPALSAGSYFLLAQVTSGRTTALGASPSAVTVAAAEAKVTAAFASPLPAKLRPGAKVTASLVLTNTGNAAADGPMRIALSIVGDAPSQSTPLMSLTRRTFIPPGRSTRLKVRLVVPAGLTPGAYSLAATLTPAPAAGKLSAATAGDAVVVPAVPVVVG
jgi:hypothetical protein